MLENIMGYLKISDEIYTSGQPSQSDILQLGKIGIKNVINLAPPVSDITLPNEGALVAVQGVNYIHIPVSFEKPDRQKFKVFVNIMRALRGEPTLVHCTYNMQTSAFIFLYRVLLLGVPKNAAKSELNKLWEPYGEWETFINELIKASKVEE